MVGISTSNHLSLVLMLSSSLMEELSWMAQQQVAQQQQRTGSPMLLTSPIVSPSMVVSILTILDEVLSLLKYHPVQILILLLVTQESISTPVSSILLSSPLPRPLKQQSMISSVSVSCSQMVILSVLHTWTTRRSLPMDCQRCSWGQFDLSEGTADSRNIIFYKYLSFSERYFFYIIFFYLVLLIYITLFYVVFFLRIFLCIFSLIFIFLYTFVFFI